MAYKVKNLIASKPGLAKVTDPELHYQVFTFLKNEDTKEILLWTPVLRREGNNKTIYLASYTLDGQIIDKVLVPDTSIEFTALQDMDINTSQGFVITNGQEKAAGTIFLAAADEGSYLYGYNELLSKIVSKDYEPNEEDNWITGFDIFDKYIYTVSDDEFARVTVYDYNFKQITDRFPFPRQLPDNYLQVNIKVIYNLVYVVSVSNNGGVVYVYNLDGTFVRTLINDPELQNAWSIVKAPKDFGYFKCSYLMASKGTINAYDKNGQFLGKLKDAQGNVIVIENLYYLKFLDEKLYFAAGNIAARDEDTNTALIGYICPDKKAKCKKY